MCPLINLPQASRDVPEGLDKFVRHKVPFMIPHECFQRKRTVPVARHGISQLPSSHAYKVRFPIVRSGVDTQRQTTRPPLLNTKFISL